MRIATWNVNSLKARLPRVEEWLAAGAARRALHAGDQAGRRRLPGPGLPGARLRERPPRRRAAGTAWPSSAGSASTTSSPGFDDGDEPDPDARLLWATCGGVRVGQRLRAQRPRRSTTTTTSTSSRWLERLRGVLDEHVRPVRRRSSSAATSTSPPTTATSTTRPPSSARPTSASPSATRSRRLEDWGLVDVFRQHYDAGGLFSWWDYRAGNFHKGKGMRIDLDPGHRVAGRARSTGDLIDRNARKGKEPSDHAPVIVDFDL